MQGEGSRTITFSRACTACASPYPLGWHHVFTPAYSAPKPSRKKILPRSFGVTSRVSLGILQNLHNWSESTVSPMLLSMEGSSGLTSRPANQRTGAGSTGRPHMIFGDLSSLRWIQVKPGFSEWPIQPPPTNAPAQNLYEETDLACTADAQW